MTTICHMAHKYPYLNKSNLCEGTRTPAPSNKSTSPTNHLPPPGLLKQITTSAVIITLEVNLCFAGYLKSWNTILQGSYSDILSAHSK